MVSVCMITYGHEMFIRQAIEGVLMQQCAFEVEFIISNDCSPDGTDAVIRKTINAHPNGSWVNYIKHKKNLGMMPNFLHTLQKAQGKYIALCEGDDYWTDPLKLQKQVDFLETNLEYVICFHKVDILKPNDEIVDDFITKVPENYETLETLARLGNYIHTPSVVFRNIIKEFPFEFEKSPIGDYFLYMMLAEHGKLKYLSEKMAIYRFGIGCYSTLNQQEVIKTVISFQILFLSYTTNSISKNIFIKRIQENRDYFEFLIKAKSIQSVISKNIFSKAVHAVINKSLWKKIVVKISNYINHK
jgi:glycosyltransferase involved in cell wall biosynthesis